MCGIAGLVHWDGEPVIPGTLEAMARTLSHRGPDAWRVEQPSAGVGLAHTRLKVIDLSEAARQPMGGGESGAWISFNGEIYNFQELRRDLESRGHRFQSRSDTEVILRAYETWGEECVARLDGMFAFAIWDGRRRELLLARDRTGKKPLFYWTDGRCAAFASEIKALLVHGHVPRAVDEAALPYLMAFGYPPGGRTCYQGIRQVPPACLMRLRDGVSAPAPVRYWSADLTPAKAQTSAEDAAWTVRSLLTDAVRRRLQSDVPLGAFLSGGIDSTIVVGLMTELMPDVPVRTFSIGFEGDDRFNETHYAELAAKRFRTRHETFVIGPQPFSLLERLVHHHDQPFGDSSAVPTYLISQLARQHVAVVLTGDGGDELFAGYARFLAARWSERIPSALLRLAHAGLSRLPAGHERTLRSKLLRFAAVARDPMPERYLRWTAYFERPWEWLAAERATSLTALAGPAASRWAARPHRSLLARLLELNFNEYLPHDLHVKTDRCSMAHGLEARSPMLDTALINYVNALPDRLKLHGWSTKVVLKDACRDLLPPAIRTRRKMGFGVPLAAWFRTGWREPLESYLGGPGVRLGRYMDAARIRGLMQAHQQGRENAGNRLWVLLTMEIWLRQLEQARWQPAAEPAAHPEATALP